MVASAQNTPCSHTRLLRTDLCRVSLNRRALLRRVGDPSSRLPVCFAKGQSYHVEVEVNEDEDPEGVYKRFRNSCNLAGMVYEARRRQYFENTQDIKKRKQQEKGMRKMRDVRERFLQTYDDAHSDTPPFSELFAGDEDIYDVLKDASYDEGLEGSRMPQGQDRPSRMNGRTNGARGSENVAVRSVPSEGPKASSGDAKAKGDGKPKPRVQTARTRRAARQQQASRKK